MKLVIFDLDGTLTATNAVDNECFARACAESLQIKTLNTNWGEYEHITDAGVVSEAFRNKFARMPSPAEIASFVDCFLRLLDQSYRKNATSFMEIPGAASLLANLRHDGRWGVAIATGCYEKSGRFKLEKARINARAIPAAFAEDGPSREAIVQAAIQRALVCYRYAQFETLILVGDAIWDVRTAKRLGLRFIGVATGERALLLRNHGAEHVIDNFLDYGICIRCLQQARIPRGVPLRRLVV